MLKLPSNNKSQLILLINKHKNQVLPKHNVILRQINIILTSKQHKIMLPQQIKPLIRMLKKQLIRLRLTKQQPIKLSILFRLKAQLMLRHNKLQLLPNKQLTIQRLNQLKSKLMLQQKLLLKRMLIPRKLMLTNQLLRLLPLPIHMLQIMTEMILQHHIVSTVLAIYQPQFLTQRFLPVMLTMLDTMITIIILVKMTTLLKSREHQQMPNKLN